MPHDEDEKEHLPPSRPTGIDYACCTVLVRMFVDVFVALAMYVAVGIGAAAIGISIPIATVGLLVDTNANALVAGRTRTVFGLPVGSSVPNGPLAVLRFQVDTTTEVETSLRICRPSIIVDSVQARPQATTFLLCMASMEAPSVPAYAIQAVAVIIRQASPIGRKAPCCIAGPIESKLYKVFVENESPERPRYGSHTYYIKIGKNKRKLTNRLNTEHQCSDLKMLDHQV